MQKFKFLRHGCKLSFHPPPSPPSRPPHPLPSRDLARKLSFPVFLFLSSRRAVPARFWTCPMLSNFHDPWAICFFQDHDQLFTCHEHQSQPTSCIQCSTFYLYFPICCSHHRNHIYLSQTPLWALLSPSEIMNLCLRLKLSELLQIFLAISFSMAPLKKAGVGQPKYCILHVLNQFNSKYNCVAFVSALYLLYFSQSDLH